MQKYLRKIALQIQNMLGVEEIFFLFGMFLLYFGCAVKYGHSIAQITTGAVLILVSILISVKGSS